MSYAIHIYGHAAGDDAKAIEGALHAKFTAILLELRHVAGHGLTSAHFEGSYVSEHLATLPAPGSAVVADEQSAESIAASRAPKTETPGSAVTMEEQDADEITRLRMQGAGALVGHVVAMDEQSADAIAVSRLPQDGPPPGSGNLYADQAPIRGVEAVTDEPLLAVPDPLPLPADGDILTDEGTGQQYRFNATTLRLVKYTAPVEAAVEEAVSEGAPADAPVNADATPVEAMSQ